MIVQPHWLFHKQHSPVFWLTISGRKKWGSPSRFNVRSGSFSTERTEFT